MDTGGGARPETAGTGAKRRRERAKDSTRQPDLKIPPQALARIERAYAELLRGRPDEARFLLRSCLTLFGTAPEWVQARRLSHERTLRRYYDPQSWSATPTEESPRRIAVVRGQVG